MHVYPLFFPSHVQSSQDPLSKKPCLTTTWFTKLHSSLTTQTKKSPVGFPILTLYAKQSRCSGRSILCIRSIGRNLWPVHQGADTPEFIADRIEELNKFLAFLLSRPDLFNIGDLKRPSLWFLQPFIRPGQSGRCVAKSDDTLCERFNCLLPAIASCFRTRDITRRRSAWRVTLK